MSKKKIDEYFQDKLLDFKEAPDDKVWTAIERSLNKKQKKRVLPIWWWLSGTAAAIFVGLLLFSPWKNTEVPAIVDTKNPIEQPANTDAPKTVKESLPTTFEVEEELKITQGDAEALKLQENKNATTSLQKPILPNAKDNTFVTRSVSKTPVGTKSDQAKNLYSQTAGEKVVSDDPQGTNNTSTTLAVVEKDSPKDAPLNETLGTSKKLVTSVVTSAAIQTQDSTRKEDSLSDTKALALEPKKSILDDIVSQEEEEENVEENGKKWSAGPTLAPVFYSAMGEGSSVNSIFVPNAKSGNTNMSYGVSFAYEVSPRLKIRSGLHSVTYGYDTNDISFTSSLSETNTGQFSTINYTPAAIDLFVFSDRKEVVVDQSDPLSSPDIFGPSPERTGNMTQELGYLEFPVELNYTLVDRKFGVHITGGFSSLFLVDNSVALSSGDLVTEIGAARNVNDINFSANFGLGVLYQFSDKIHLALEPMFKYQLNTFSSTEGTFNPYALGVYSGLSFKF